MNSMYTQTTLKTLTIAIIATLALLSSCISHDQDLNSTADYLPLTNNAEWAHLIERFSAETGEPYGTDTITTKVTGDTTILGKTYKIVSEYWFESNFIRENDFIRKEGSAYYKLYSNPYYNKLEEYKMLDTALPINNSWTFEKSEDHKIEFTILARNHSKTVNGVTYNDVVEIAESYYYKENGNWTKSFTNKICYALNVGMIHEDDNNQIFGSVRTQSLLSHKH
jgi:hypothetical protein